MKQKNKSKALRISFYFLSIGVIWILISDQILHLLTPTRESYELYQTYKGWFYVFSVSILFYFVLRYNYRKIVLYQTGFKETDLKFKTYINHAPIGVFIVDETGRYLEVNQYGQSFLGYDEKELTEMTINDVTFPGDRERALNDFLLLKVKDTLSGEYRFHTKKGNVGWWRIEAVKIKENTFLGFTLDISEQKRIHTELLDYKENLERMIELRTNEIDEKANKLKRSQKAMRYLLEDVNEARSELLAMNAKLQEINNDLESFTYSVSHDLKSPLRAINAYLNAFKEDYEKNEKNIVFSYLDKAINNTLKLNTMIEDLLKFSRVTKNEFVISNINVSKMADDILENLSIQYPRIKMNWSVDADIYVKGDMSAINQVMHNLIENAIKFSSKKKNPQIQIYKHQKNEKNYVVVEDNGIGFDPDSADRIFSVFNKLNPEGEFEGSGIGLATVKRIVKKHNGEVFAESNPGVGSRFYLFIP